MPTNRTRRRRSRVQPGDLPTGHLEVHLRGCTFFQEGFATEDERRQSYFTHRDYLLSLVGVDIAEVDPDAFLPAGAVIPCGCRPYDYWRFEPLPEPRRIIKRLFGFGPNGHTYYPEGSESLLPSGGGKLKEVYHYEPQDVYLRRNGLLLPGEGKKINPALIPQHDGAPEEAWQSS